MGKVTIDLVTERPDGALVLILVEEGPWSEGQEVQELRRVQDRLYNCVDAAVDGHVAQRFPDWKGGLVVIRLDCYKIKHEAIATFFEAFRDHMTSDAEIQSAIMRSRTVSELRCELHCEGDA